MIREIEIRAIAEVIAWSVVFAISGWALIINQHKQPRPSDPQSVSSASGE